MVIASWRVRSCSTPRPDIIEYTVVQNCSDWKLNASVFNFSACRVAVIFSIFNESFVKNANPSSAQGCVDEVVGEGEVIGKVVVETIPNKTVKTIIT